MRGADGGLRRGLGILWETVRTVAFLFVLLALVRGILVEAFKIPTGSMENTLLVGDFLLVNKVVYGAEIPGTSLHLPPLREPDHGEVIVFHPPHDPVRNYVKRVVGIPGDTLEMRGKRLFRNGEEVEEPYARHRRDRGDARHPDMQWQRAHLVARPSSRYRPSRDRWGPLVVPSDRYFVLGDNRDNSEDSRYWGFVERDAIRGRPWVVYFSSESMGEGILPWLAGARWSRIGGRIR